jgi:DNA-binding NarL/FixJ family response regulator
MRPQLRDKRILLADDEEVWRIGCCTKLEEAGAVVETCVHGMELQDILTKRATDFDAAIVDLKRMGTDRTFEEMLPRLSAAFPNLPIIICSNDDTMAAHFLGLSQGNIKGFVVKIDGTDALCDMLETVLRGKPGGYSKSVLMRNRLTPKQLQVLKLIARDGMTRQEVAEHMEVSGVDDHCTQILMRLGAKSMSQAVYIAMKAGVLR